MTLYMIGIGLSDEKDISVKGLEAVKKCSRVYLESYTSILLVSVSKLEKFYGKKIILADREMVEKNPDEILSKDKDIAFLVIGDVFSATTHIDLMQRARKKNIDVRIIHGASVVSAVGITGLEVYKFGKVTSIPFENENVKTPVEVLKGNQRLGLHTLFLLDLRPDENKFLTIADAADYLIRNDVDENTYAVGCARLGSEKQIIKYKKLIDLKKENFGKPPYCLIIPGKLHFVEEEMLNQS